MKLFSFICHYAPHYNICFLWGEQVPKQYDLLLFDYISLAFVSYALIYFE